MTVLSLLWQLSDSFKYSLVSSQNTIICIGIQQLVSILSLSLFTLLLAMVPENPSNSPTLAGSTMASLTCGLCLVG